jgi:hypothetical protein
VGGIVDIPFPRSIHDELLKQGLAQEHHWVPDSGWITFHVRKREDFNHALWLMRFSYSRYVLKTAPDPRQMFEHQCEQLHLNPGFKSLLEAFIPKTSKQFRPSQSLHRSGWRDGHITRSLSEEL